MKRKIYILTVLICILAFMGCEKKSDTNESKKDTKDVSTIMNVPVDEISTIELYSKGECTTVSADSEEFLKLAKIIDDAENNEKGGSGGADLTDSAFIIPTGTTYAEYTEDEACRVYIVKFKEKQAVTYGDYSSKKPNEDAVFIIPEKNMFGIIINDEDGNPNSYETFMDVDRDIFEEFIGNSYQSDNNSEYEYSKYFDENIIWGKNQLTNAVESETKLGEVVCSCELQELLDENTSENEKNRYAITLMEYSGKDIEYVYSELVKKLDFETEFTGMTDEEVQMKLEAIKAEGTDEFQMFRCMMFATKEEILSMECPKDMEILLDTVIRTEPFQVTE